MCITCYAFVYMIKCEYIFRKKDLLFICNFKNVWKYLIQTSWLCFFPLSPLFCPQGIRARILETLVMLILLALLILGIVWVASALIDNDAASMESLYGMECKRSFIQFHCKYRNAGFQLNVFLVHGMWVLHRLWRCLNSVSTILMLSSVT